MRNKLLIGVVLVFIAIFFSLFIQNMKLKKQMNELVKQKDEAKKAASVNDAQPANPEGASPFDKPNNDPFANQFNPTSPGKTPTTTIRFDALIHDFGRINEGEKVKTKFKLYNTGDHTLLIYTAHASCGCTVPDWPRQPIKPGESGDINVEFDSGGKQGEITKTIGVSNSSTVPLVSLTIKATVIPKDR